MVTQIRLVQAILRDAITQWLASNPTAANANSVVVAGAETRYPGDGFPDFSWVYGSKYGQVTLGTKYGITVTGTITVSIPYGDVV
jgi:hypothetical protein